MQHINSHYDAQNDFNNKINNLLNNEKYSYLNKNINFNKLVLTEKQRLLSLNPITTPKKYLEFLITNMNIFIKDLINEYNNKEKREKLSI
jgi:hypothetical protein